VDPVSPNNVAPTPPTFSGVAMIEPGSPKRMWIVQMPRHHGRFSPVMLCETDDEAARLERGVRAAGSDAWAIPVTVTIHPRHDTEDRVYGNPAHRSASLRTTSR
jgi:hypothetical protein